MVRGKPFSWQIHVILILTGYIVLNVASGAETVGIAADKTGSTMSNLNWSTSAGIGYNSNIYRAPDQQYIDYAPATPVNVDPVVHSGFFIPLGFKANYQNALDDKNSLLMDYDFYGNFYVDSDYRNADEMSHTVDIGDEFTLGKKGRIKDSVYAGVLFIKKEEEYTERDTGLDKFSTGGVNISDRYPYTGTGIKVEYDKRISNIKYGFKYKYLNRDYKDAIAISQLDHKYTMLAGDVKFSLNKQSKLRFKYKHYVYDYKERPSRDINGRALTSNPPLEYVYDDFITTYIYKVNRQVRMFFDYSYKIRSDEYVGYNDYERNKIKIRALYDYNRELGLKFTFMYWDRKYPNAYAFDRFVAGANEVAKSYDGVKLEIEGDYSLAKHRTYWADFEWRDENSSDLRYQYDRVKIMTGIKWDY